MANENKLMLATQQEKPNHYTPFTCRYLKEFRVEQCQSFLQHKCNQHRPFICFNWHFQNQRRRRPIRKRDGTFNYSADNYCTKYDETTGLCPDGDDCPFLHRTAGDTERRYHLRYYKTCMCVHDTDSRGYCVKNGHHCAFAHGVQDQRPPVYDIKELETLQNSENAIDGTNAQNALDKERNLMNEDPKWQDTNYVLANYKTEPCKRPPRLCRQGYACPQFHNSKDKRRSPRKFKYRSTPCPNVKHGEEWGEPGNCEAGDNCQYCHTRTEQQFHPEIYKSTKCNDVQQAGYCPRSVFCAFAHVEPYILTEDKPRDIDGPSTNLALSDIISSALPEIKKDPSKQGLISVSDNLFFNGNGESCESASTSSIGSSNSHIKAPGAQLQQKNTIYGNSNDCYMNGGSSSSPFSSNKMSHLEYSKSHFQSLDMAKLMGIENDSNSIINALDKNQGKFLNFTLPLERLYEMRDIVPNQRENPISAGLAQSGLLQRSSAPINIPNSQLTNSISDFNSGGFSVNIPGSSLNYSPTNHSNLFNVADVFNYSGSGSKLSNSLTANQNDSSSLFFQPRIISPGFGDSLSISPSVRITELNSIRADLTSSSVGNSLFDNNLQNNKPAAYSLQSIQTSNPDVVRLNNDLTNKTAQIIKLQTTLKLEMDECNRKLSLIELQRDKAKQEALDWKERFDLAQTQINLTADLRSLSISKLKQLQSKLRTDLEEVEKVLYSETATKCMKCEENNRTITLDPCNHFILCDTCARSVTECPYCQTPVTVQA
ncbi:RING finger protein unkempt isoform X3 [Eupeodes corollae]|uniref:RING finger protein unkempt isoform X3 n=1 Tax=Eupeodes corollae TaxID=290404 RepID=UPI0024901EA7|nr:RING finger protein unkempt isoform X3 [Eupeodes corollae]